MFHIKSPLCMPVKDGAGSGAGAGAGAGEGNNPGAFDSKAFLQELLGEFDKRTNALDKKINALQKSMTTKPTEGDSSAGGDSAGGGDSGGDTSKNKPDKPEIKDPAVNAVIQNLQRQVNQLTKQAMEAQKREQEATAARLETERLTAIRNHLNAVPFKDQESRDLYYDAVAGKVTRDESGELIVSTKDGPLPFTDYIDSHVEKFPNLLQPKVGGGAGATGGTRKLGSGPNIDHMTPAQIAALKPEEKAQLYQDVAARANAEFSQG
jgi:hypothetical protein